VSFGGTLSCGASALRGLEHGLRAALAELKADMIMWVAGLLLAQAALVATLVKLL
jgi:hypothetical protein